VHDAYADDSAEGTTNESRLRFEPLSACVFSSERHGADLGKIITISLAALFLTATLFATAARAVPSAPTFTVNSRLDLPATGDLANGICQTALPNVCSLRAAVEKANGWPAGDATINFVGVTPPATYTLSLGTLVITNSMTIVGAGPRNTIVDGSGALPIHRVLEISTGTLMGGAPVNISGITVRGGHTTDAGAAIFVFGGRASIDNSLIQDNGCACITPTNGVILNDGILTLTNSIVADNDVGSGGLGGGIYNGNTAWLSNDTIRNNSAQVGGGIYNDGDMMVLNSAIISNSVTASGGGIRSTNNSLVIENSTISSNSANGAGGGLYDEAAALLCRQGSVSLYNTTVTNNIADADLSSGADSGGVSNETPCVAFSFKNGIIAYNFGAVLVGGFRVNAPNQDCAGTLTSQGFNIVGGVPPDCTLNGPYTVADAKLGPLQNNGGPTPTHALLPGSPAIDAGETPLCTNHAGLPVLGDQRGFARPAFGAVALRCDIGAFELYRFGDWVPLIVR
jgi:hypothetical protein